VSDPEIYSVPGCKLTFNTPNKTGCTSIKQALARGIGVPPLLIGNPHDSSRFHYLKGVDEVPEDHTVVLSVRQVMGRLASCWRNKVQGKPLPAMYEQGFRGDMTFEDFCHLCCDIPDEEADQHFRSQTYYHSRYDHLLRCEHLAGDWEKIAPVLKKQGLLYYPVQKLNSSSGAVPSLPTPAQKKVGKRYEKDFDFTRKVYEQ